MISSILGIDAQNIRAGGGITHLSELLSASTPEKYGFKKVIVWSGTPTLSKLPKRSWLELKTHAYLDKGILFRFIWSFFIRPVQLRKEKCSMLFVPGGTEFSSFSPMVTMSQNLLPFEWKELRRYGWSFMTLKSILLRFSQSKTFRKADGVIFLTKYAEKAALKITGNLHGDKIVIPHGINPMFDNPPTSARYSKEFSQDRPCRILYVSGLEPYKHQWHVAEAVSSIIQQGIPVRLDLVGPSGPALKKLTQVLDQLDPNEEFIKYHGPVRYDNLQKMYSNADIGVFASSCETFGQILTEAMSAGLPMTCSHCSAMPEILEDFGVYFNPEFPKQIEEAILKLFYNHDLREALANGAYLKSKTYSWEKCADHTFRFLMSIAEKKHFNNTNLE